MSIKIGRDIASLPIFWYNKIKKEVNMILTIAFFIAASIFALLGMVYLILYRALEKSSDKIATTKALFTGTKTTYYRGRKIYCPVYEYTVNGKKYRRRVEPQATKPHRNSEAIYSKAFPRIAYIKYSGNDFGMSAFGCFAGATCSIIFSLISYFIFYIELS